MAADKPNIPHHYDRRATDYPKKPAPKYGWRDDNGRPIHEIDEHGNPICGRRSNSTGRPCHHTWLCPNGRCALKTHGGTSIGGNLKHGRSSIFLPLRLAADYEKIAKDDVLDSIRQNIAIMLAMVRERCRAISNSPSAEQWKAARSACDALHQALQDDDAVAVDAAIEELGQILHSGTNSRENEEDAVELMLKAGKLSKVEISRLKSFGQFMTASQMLANQAAVIDVLRKHVEPEVLSRVAADISAASSPRNCPRNIGHLPDDEDDV